MEALPFEQWPLRDALRAALAAHGFERPTPVQQEAFQPLLDGRDVVVQSRTGSGKTLAFLLPILQRMDMDDAARGAFALVVLPTRELAAQVASIVGKLQPPSTRGGPARLASLCGGASYREQFQALARGARIVVGTPGRLCDHLERGSLDLSACRTLVLDEADEMLDMGFAADLERIGAAMPKPRQTLLFSATMPKETRELAKKLLVDPVSISISSGLAAATEIVHHAYEVFRERRVDALVNILHFEAPALCLVFCHTRLETESLAQRLLAEGFDAAFLNGDLPQAQRDRTLEAFRRRELRFLVATDVAARGIDVAGITHVVNLAVPANPETYIHRVGRTGRAGAAGTAITLVAPQDAARFRRMLGRANLRVETRAVPKAEEVRGVAQNAFRSELAARIEEGSGDASLALAEELLSALPARELVAALLRGDRAAARALEAGIDVPVPRPSPPPAPAARQPKQSKHEKQPQQPAPRGPAGSGDPAPGRGPGPAAGPPPARSGSPAPAGRRMPDRPESGFRRVYLNVGKDHGLSTGGVLDMLARDAGLGPEYVGPIAVHPYFCFFDIVEREAPGLVGMLQCMTWDGRPVRANLVDTAPGEHARSRGRVPFGERQRERGAPGQDGPGGPGGPSARGAFPPSSGRKKRE
jgi:ATP-dependent RNA helicase DeaD